MTSCTAYAAIDFGTSTLDNFTYSIAGNAVSVNPPESGQDPSTVNRKNPDANGANVTFACPWRTSLNVYVPPGPVSDSARMMRELVAHEPSPQCRSISAAYLPDETKARALRRRTLDTNKW